MNTSGDIRGFDFHCHIDLHPDPPAIVGQCERDRVVVIAVTTTPKAWPQNRAWTEGSSYVHAAVGLHPELVAERYAEIEMLEQAIGSSRLVGEIGLDRSPKFRASFDKQKEVFARALSVSQMHGGRVVTIHSRHAASDVITTIEECTRPSDVLCILHWFSGSAAEARRAAKAGCYFSVNSAMLKSDRRSSLVQCMPRDRLLTETDSPFTTINGRKSTPTDAIATIEELSEIFGEPVLRTAESITRNALQVLRFAGIVLTDSDAQRKPGLLHKTV